MTDASTPTNKALSAADLRWICDPQSFGFTTTAEIEPVKGVIGQEAAIEAMRFGLECTAHGQNVFVKGLTGTGRMTVIGRLVTELRPQCPLASDRCYVHNFTDPACPKLLTLPRCTAKHFERLVGELADFIRDDLRGVLSSDSIKNRLSALKEAAQNRIQEASRLLEVEASEAGMALVIVTAGQLVRPAIFPRIDDHTVTIEELELLHQQGKVSDEDHAEFYDKRAALDEKLDALNSQIDTIVREHLDVSRAMLQKETRTILRHYVDRLISEFPQAEVGEFLDAVLTDVVENRMESDQEQGDFTRRYRANVVLSQESSNECPAIIEHTPTCSNLVGSIDSVVTDHEIRPADHLSIRGGSLLRADGGYLVLDARDLLSEPGAWKALIRTLRSGTLEIANIESPSTGLLNLLKPQAIDINVKVILVGDSDLYAQLDRFDSDFPHLFKVLAEFDSTIENTRNARKHYAEVIARIAEEDNLLPFSCHAVAALAEHGARIASSRVKLTTRFSRLADISREAAFLAAKRRSASVSSADVQETVSRTKRRANLSSRKFREYIEHGVIRVQLSGESVGQINGLAVTQAGPITYGFPARITATIGAGTSGIINVERESELSGSIHTKGFQILKGLIRYLLQTTHPLVFDAAIAFEQSYGGIDGDSASGAEFCCLISALTDVPLRQDLAMTGAIDQHGNIMAIGGVNEKIEGFFDACTDAGLTGTQGVLIPHSNVDDLMLRHDVVDAARAGRFHVRTVKSVGEALELLTGVSIGYADQAGKYPRDSLLGKAVERAGEYWKMAASLGACKART